MRNKFSLLFILLFIIYFFPYFYLGENFPLDVFDNMDSNIGWMKLTLENFHLIFSPSDQIPNLLGGVSPFTAVYPIISISTLFFWLAGYYWGFVICKMIMVLFGYYGMSKCLQYVVKIKSKWLIWGLSVSFSFIPFWGDSLHIIGMPYLIYCFYAIYIKQYHWSNWLYMLIFPFYSALYFVGIFVFIVNGIILLVDLVKLKKIKVPFLLANIVLGVFYLVGHFPLILSYFLDNKFVSHRTAVNLLQFSFTDTIKYMGAILIRGDFAYHGNKPYFNVIYFAPVILGFIYMFIKNIRKRMVVLLSAFLFLTSALVFIMYWTPIMDLYVIAYKKLPISWDRILWFYPIFWIVSFALVADFVISKVKWSKAIIFGMVFIQTCIILYNHKVIHNNGEPSFKEFYAEHEFNQIEEAIGRKKDSYRIMNIGLHPAVSLFNGFYTIDGFSGNYPLDYKLKYNEIIKNELNKKGAIGISKQFNNWGSWCYSFTEEVGFNLHKNFVTKINSLDYNWDVARELGAEYVVSTGEINLPNLKLIKKISKDSENYYPIFLYRIESN